VAPRAAAAPEEPLFVGASTPEEQGIASAKLAQALLTMRARNIQIHSLLVIRNGDVVTDAYFYPYDGSTVHDLASVTKSVMTTLIAIAAGQGKLDLDQPLVSFFPGRSIANLDERKERITVRHLASMASGLESMGFAQDEGTLTEMEASPNYVQFALDRKAVLEPGTQFVYDSPGMHLLSAILQQATGMTALEFAQENLFAPLGIEEVIWPSDAQGVTHGWGDLHLHPHDAAKLGYLWLNGGEWDGKQIVPRAWVEESVKVQSEIPNERDDYGYGWWVTPDSGAYTAVGRGGQYVKVIPSLNALVMATGGGFSFDEIEPLLIDALRAALVDPNKHLPANPDGVAQLDAAVAAVTQPPAPGPVAALPPSAQEISGKVYAFGPNPAEVDALGLAFDDSAEATLLITPAGSDQLLSWPIGLDGAYRFSQGDFGLPQGLRGAWADDGTFVLEYDGIAANSHVIYRIQFTGDRMLVAGAEFAHELGAQFEGVLQGE
jgi:CubicO group peptidase (beta-lactamase class C family)